MAGRAPPLYLAIVMAVLTALGEVLRVATGWVRAGQAERVQDHIAELIHAKSAEVDLAFYEMPEYYDRLHRARADASHRPVELLEATGSLLQNSITLVAMAALLLTYGPWLPVVLLLSTLPAVYVVLHYALRERAWRVRRNSQGAPDLVL